MQLLLKNPEIARKVRIAQSLRTSRMSGLESLLGRNVRILPGIKQDGTAVLLKIYLPEGQKPRIPGLIPLPGKKEEIMQEPYQEWGPDMDTIQGREASAQLQSLAFLPLTSLLLLETGVPSKAIHEANLPDFTMVVDCPKEWEGFPDNQTYFFDIDSPEILKYLQLPEYIQPWQIGAPAEAKPLSSLLLHHKAWFPEEEPIITMASPNIWGILAINEEGREKTATLTCGWEPKYMDESFGTLVKEWLTHNRDWLIISETETSFEAVI